MLEKNGEIPKGGEIVFYLGLYTPDTPGWTTVIDSYGLKHRSMVMDEDQPSVLLTITRIMNLWLQVMYYG